jgi:hypothetical protein
MSTPGKYDVTAYRGDTFGPLRFRVALYDGSTFQGYRTWPVDAVVLAQVRASADATAVLLQLDSAIDGEWVVLSKPAGWSVPDQAAKWDVEVNCGPDDTRTYLAGVFKVTADVSRSP